MKKRLGAILLCAAMTAGMVPCTALAEEETQDGGSMVSVIGQIAQQRTQEDTAAIEQPQDDELSGGDELILIDSGDGSEIVLDDGDAEQAPETESPEIAVKPQATASGTCGDNVRWTLDEDGLLTISGTGKMGSYGDEATPWAEYCQNIKKAVIESGVTSVGDGAFLMEESHITSVTIPDTVTSIGDGAFAFCEELTKITIPASVTSIGEVAFTGCTALKSITVKSGNTKFVSSGSVLFDKNKKTLIQYPAGKTAATYEIPSTVTEIKPFAFSFCSGLTEMSIPKAVATIGIGAFSGCESLRKTTVFPTNCVIDSYDSEAEEYLYTLGDNATIYGYKNSTAQQYAKALQCQFVEIEACKHEKTKRTTTPATTTKDGQYTYTCQQCGEVTKTTRIYKASKISLKTTTFTYNGKKRKPTVVVKNSKGTVIPAEHYTVTPTGGRKNVGQQTVTLKFNDQKYSGTWSGTFQVRPAATTLTSLTAKSKGFQVKWKKKTTQTTGYQLQYSTSKSFGSRKNVWLNKNSTTSTKVGKLKASRTYYVRLRTYKTVSGKKYYSSWTTVKSVKTKK